MKIFLLILLSIILVSCVTTVKSDLPEATQVGNDTFGCLVDDQLWLPKRATSISGSPPSVEALYNKVTCQMKILAFQFETRGNSFILKATVTALGKATLLIDQVNPEEATYYDDGNDSYIPLTTTSFLTITKLDTLNRIVSGSFALEVVGQKTKRRVSISKGVFDIHFEQ